MLFFIYIASQDLSMKILQFIGVLLVVIGSFLPLVHVPVVGYWDYWNIDHSLAVIVWILIIAALIFILKSKKSMLRLTAVLMIILFLFTIMAVKMKSLDFFSFLPFKSWQGAFAGTVKLSWGWVIEFLGAILILISSKKNQNTKQL